MLNSKIFKNIGLKSDIIILTVFSLFIIISRLPFVSRYLYEWDSVNFALALERYDLALHQPQPPGYILYVATGKLFNAITHDANTALILISIIFSILTVILTYFLAKSLFSRKVAIAGSIILIFSPIFWFYGEIATIYPAEAFFAVLIAYSSYQALKGKERFIYISAFILGIAGGFRQDLIVFMFPVWLYSLVYAGGYKDKNYGDVDIGDKEYENNDYPHRDYKHKDYKKIITAFSVFIVSCLIWIIPTIMLAGGLENYLYLSKHFSGSFGTSSVFFGAPLSNHLLMDALFVSWFVLGLGFIGALLLILFIIKNHKSIFTLEIFKNHKFTFLSLWILPAFLFLIFIPLSKPGYSLTYLPALGIIIGYVIVVFSKNIGQKFSISSKSVYSAILIIYILTSCVYFLYPYNLNEESTWETQINHMNDTQKTILALDLLFMYNNEKIVINDRSMDWHLNAIINISNSSPNSTQIIIRDIIREDQGFSWRKAMYYLPEYDVYYLFDAENSELKSSKMTSNVSFSYGKRHVGNGSEGEVLEIPISPTTKNIVWIMDDKSSFYKDLDSEIEIKILKLPNGLNIYYSDVSNQEINFTVGGFIFRTINAPS